MEAKIVGSGEKKLVGAILLSGHICLRSKTPETVDKSYYHIVSEVVTLTTGSPEYWVSIGNATPIYEGDKVEIQF